MLKNLEKNMNQFFADHLFQILKKYTYKYSKNLAHFFASHLCQILKKVYLKNFKKNLVHF